MDAEAVKSEMKKLWKETFHDSDAYIDLIFENYFNPRYAIVEECDGKIVSALLGIDYCFGGKSINSDEKELAPIRGLYLCGLATRPEYRRQGIMNSMIEKINSIAAEDGFSFTFLIPADDGLRLYYRDRNYISVFNRIEYHFIAGHNFLSGDINYDLVKCSILSCCELSQCSAEIIEKSAAYYRSKEALSPLMTICHSHKDMLIAFAENELSEGKIFITFDKENNLRSIAVINSFADNQVDISSLYFEDEYCRDFILASIARLYPDKDIVLKLNYPAFESHALWEPYYVPDGYMTAQSEMPYSDGLRRRPYAMLRLLNPLPLLRCIAKENAQLETELDVEGCYLLIERGEVRELSRSDSEFRISSRRPDRYSLVELAAILWRSRASGVRAADDPFELPPIDASISLMLD